MQDDSYYNKLVEFVGPAVTLKLQAMVSGGACWEEFSDAFADAVKGHPNIGLLCVYGGRMWAKANPVATSKNYYAEMVEIGGADVAMRTCLAVQEVVPQVVAAGYPYSVVGVFPEDLIGFYCLFQEAPRMPDQTDGFVYAISTVKMEWAQLKIGLLPAMNKYAKEVFQEACRVKNT